MPFLTSLVRLAKYFYFKALQPDHIDFVDTGLGIEARANKFGDKWLAHLNASKKFQLDSISESSPCKSVVVLGAGRLFDLPTEEFSERFEKITLIDADPCVEGIWKRFKSKSKADISWQIIDITSRLKIWTDKLRNYLKKEILTSTISKEKLSAFLISLTKEEIATKWQIPKSELLISLNILSQLSLYWRDRVHSLINEFAPYLLGSELELESEIENALKEMAILLESEHIEMLFSSNAKKIIFLFDDEFYYYKAERSAWQVEQALSISVPSSHPEYTIEDKSSWLWHLVPEGGEGEEYGEIHRVQAVCWNKNC